MSKIITVTIEVLIFASLVGIIASASSDAAANMTGTAKVLVGLVTVFVVIGFIVMLMKQMGLKTGR